MWDSNEIWSGYPEFPDRDEWRFLDELKTRETVKVNWKQNPTPDVVSVKDGLKLIDQYGVAGNLTTATDDLKCFCQDVGLALNGTLPLKLARTQVDGHESYRIIVNKDEIRLEANDDDGMRRAIYYLEKQLSGSPGPFLKPGTTIRKPWLKNRISRCFFGPIKRPPFNRDELLDDIDYYPDEYLNRLAHEGINGLWLTIVFDEIAETSFRARDPQAEARLAKLRRTVDQCLKYGIKTWLFSIEPRALALDSPLLKAHPEFGGCNGYGGKTFCPSTPEAQQYLYECTKDIFSRVPGLGGLINISHGERTTTCLSSVLPTYDRPVGCPRCASLPKWRILEQSLGAMVRGMRDANPDTELISWLYQPQVEPHRASWVFELPRHCPEGVVVQYNFESGAMRKQLDRWRSGGDYWLSYVGPAQAFERIAENAREAGTPLSAKIQVGCSHEVATVPYVPVPGLLYQKYREMHRLGCTSVMQCWYFGNYPGVMNEAAGELAFEEFLDGEREFLERLARPLWGEDAATMMEIWSRYTEGYSNYPLSNDMQYYGPMHCGVSWPLLHQVEMKPLAPTWKPDFPVSGDTIGECLENHSLEEALELSRRMCDPLVAVADLVDSLRVKYAGNAWRLQDLGVLEALRIQFESARNIFEFYLNRRDAVFKGRGGDATGSGACIGRMEQLVRDEIELSSRLDQLCRSDSRLGFHSEAEAHQYCSSRLQWRVSGLRKVLDALCALRDTLASGGRYPLSEFEKSAERYVIGSGETGDASTRWRMDVEDGGDLILRVRCLGDYASDAFVVASFDLTGTRFPWQIRVWRGGKSEFSDLSRVTTESGQDSWTATVRFPASIWNNDACLRPAWFVLYRDASGSASGKPSFRYSWPLSGGNVRPRLNLGAVQGNCCGRLVCNEK